MRKNIFTIFLLKLTIVCVFLLPTTTKASVFDGTILNPNQYAWGENVGWVNFGTLHGDVHVTDTQLTGYIWEPVYGWINLNPPTAGVKNDAQGNLSGHAWSAGMGFINFDGVHIDSSGIFHGQANGSLFGILNFDCVSCIVATDYRPGSSLMTQGGGFFTQPYNLVGTPLPPPPQIVLPPEVIEEINQQDEVIPPIVVEEEPLSEFALLLANFPLFKDILNKLNVNVARESEALRRITNINFTLPDFLKNSLSFVNIFGLRITSLPGQLRNGLGIGIPSTGKPLQTGLSSNDIRNFKGLSLVDLPIEIKKGVPEEVLFTRAGNANIDIPINLKVDKAGRLNRSIELTSNKRVTFIVKPKQDKKVDAITGYLVFKSKFYLNKTTPVSLKENIFPSLIATAHAEGISNLPEIIPEAQVEDMFVLMQFPFTDSNKDGLYVANINTPAVEGNYEIVTSIDYRGEKIPKVLRLITLIDPEGYIYESAGENETRIRNAKVTMLRFDEITAMYKDWNAKDFAQKNPQITNQTGQYSYLVPEGIYQLRVEAKGYETYHSKEFTAEEGDSLHENIELIPNGFRFSYLWLLFIPIFFW